jgi:hypothetical protein
LLPPEPGVWQAFVALLPVWGLLLWAWVDYRDQLRWARFDAALKRWAEEYDRPYRERNARAIAYLEKAAAEVTLGQKPHE